MGPRVMLRAPRPRDYDEWRELRRESRDFLKPFEPRWSEADLSRRVFLARLKRGREEARDGTDYRFLVFLRDGRQRSAGRRHHPLQHPPPRRPVRHPRLLDGPGVRRAGLMTEAVGVVIPFAFDTLGLHRIHAAFLPTNTASRRVLEKNGFREEGYAENYLQIDGKWCDHVLFGLTRERYDATRRR